MKRLEWKHPETITGPPAEKDRFFVRNDIIEEFWREIKKGSHILFAAPRRVGKTSIMKHLESNCKDGYVCCYKDIESSRNQKDFFEQLFHIMINELPMSGKLRKNIHTWFTGRSISELSIKGSIKFISKEVDYKKELLALIKELEHHEHRVVIFLDEFPEVLSAIRKNEGAEKAIEVLNTIREIRHNKDFKHFVLVLAGSIGLDHVVESLDRPKLINDLHVINLPPLKRQEACEFINMLIENATMQIQEKEIDYFLDKISYHIPYFIQVMIEECDSILYDEDRTELQIEDIDLAFERVIRNNKNLSDWKERLKEPYLQKNVYQFCLKVLSHCAHKGKISIQEVYNYANEWKQSDDYMKHIRMLVHDGYLIEDSNEYHFVSPILQEWWKQEHPIFENENK